MNDILSVRETLCRLDAEGLHISEYTLRELIKTKVLPVRYIGRKALIYYPNVESYLRFGEANE